jgi:hypothetical protein
VAKSGELHLEYEQDVIGARYSSGEGISLDIESGPIFTTLHLRGDGNSVDGAPFSPKLDLRT